MKRIAIVSLCCTTGGLDMAEAFTRNGNAYIAPAGYIEGNSALAFAVLFFYFAAQNGHSEKSAHRLAASTDGETFRFKYYN